MRRIITVLDMVEQGFNMWDWDQIWGGSWWNLRAYLQGRIWNTLQVQEKKTCLYRGDVACEELWTTARSLGTATKLQALDPGLQTAHGKKTRWHAKSQHETRDGAGRPGCRGVKEMMVVECGGGEGVC